MVEQTPKVVEETPKAVETDTKPMDEDADSKKRKTSPSAVTPSENTSNSANVCEEKPSEGTPAKKAKVDETVSAKPVAVE